MKYDTDNFRNRLVEAAQKIITEEPQSPARYEEIHNLKMKAFKNLQRATKRHIEDVNSEKAQKEFARRFRNLADIERIQDYEQSAKKLRFIKGGKVRIIPRSKKK